MWRSGLVTHFARAHTFVSNVAQLSKVSEEGTQRKALLSQLLTDKACPLFIVVVIVVVIVAVVYISIAVAAAAVVVGTGAAAVVGRCMS